MQLNPEKCQLCRKEVRYLDHIVSPSGVTTDTEQLEAVKNWPRPKAKYQLRNFLGLCTYYRRFISRFAKIAKPLTRLSEEKMTFDWSTETETAIQTVKGALCTAPVLGYPRPGENIIFDTDTSDVGIGVCCPRYKMVVNEL